MSSSSSRTGTARYQRARAALLRDAQAQGITRCPECGTELYYGPDRRPDKATADHIRPYSQLKKLGLEAYADAAENLRVICLDCNIRLGDKRSGRRTGRRYRPAPPTVDW